MCDILDGGDAVGIVLIDGVPVDAGGGAGDDGEGEQGGDAGSGGLTCAEADVVGEEVGGIGLGCRGGHGGFALAGREGAIVGAHAGATDEARHAEDADTGGVEDKEADGPVKAFGEEEQIDELDDKAGDEGGGGEGEGGDEDAPIDGGGEGHHGEDGIDGQHTKSVGGGGVGLHGAPASCLLPAGRQRSMGKGAVEVGRLLVPEGLEVGENGVFFDCVNA